PPGTCGDGGSSRSPRIRSSATLDRNVRFKSARANQGRCSAQKTAVSCALGDLGDGESAIVTIVVRPSKKGTVTNTASVAAVEPVDPDTSNNTASETTTVES